MGGASVDFLRGPPGLLSCLPSQSQCGEGSTSAACMEARRQLRPPGVLWLAFASLISCLLAPGQAKIYSRCELFRVLQTFGLEGYQGYSLADWICLAYYTSGFNTELVDHEPDGSTNNGIFQISSQTWCRNINKEGPNRCHMYCTDLLNSNLKDSVVCAMKISQETQGLSSWEAWRRHCQGQDLSDWVDGCDF
ncbi:sperm acrosome membrane-associated protein 3-like [Sturnira hondurensis]|uniref:sperm acrosome membrane-associated protein 3-like n=1 Tax=Sturnira hondurensis TaxID=192404 RepID=UPI0018792090|nr:sperm acrosome membrane-associated protein 3-like [Sturnira hondurensis]